MAPIPRIGLECRLGDPAPQLDLQQCIQRDDGEPALLRDFLAGHPAAAAGRRRPGRGSSASARPGRTRDVLHRGVAEVFLEYDLDTAPQPA